MAQLLIRNLSESTKTYIRRRAKRNGRSMEAEVREILDDVTKHERKKPEVGFGTASVALFSGRGIYLDEPIKEFRGMKMQIPNFEEDKYEQ